MFDIYEHLIDYTSPETKSPMYNFVKGRRHHLFFSPSPFTRDPRKPSQFPLCCSASVRNESYNNPEGVNDSSFRGSNLTPGTDDSDCCNPTPTLNPGYCGNVQNPAISSLIEHDKLSHNGQCIENKLHEPFAEESVKVHDELRECVEQTHFRPYAPLRGSFGSFCSQQCIDEHTPSYYNYECQAVSNVFNNTLRYREEDRTLLHDALQNELIVPMPGIRELNALRNKHRMMIRNVERQLSMLREDSETTESSDEMSPISNEGCLPDLEVHQNSSQVRYPEFNHERRNRLFRRKSYAANSDTSSSSARESNTSDCTARRFKSRSVRKTRRNIRRCQTVNTSCYIALPVHRRSLSLDTASTLSSQDNIFNSACQFSLKGHHTSASEVSSLSPMRGTSPELICVSGEIPHWDTSSQVSKSTLVAMRDLTSLDSDSGKHSPTPTESTSDKTNSSTDDTAVLKLLSDSIDEAVVVEKNASAENVRVETKEIVRNSSSVNMDRCCYSEAISYQEQVDLVNYFKEYEVNEHEMLSSIESEHQDAHGKLAAENDELFSTKVLAATDQLVVENNEKDDISSQQETIKHNANRVYADGCCGSPMSLKSAHLGQSTIPQPLTPDHRYMNFNNLSSDFKHHSSDSKLSCCSICCSVVNAKENVGENIFQHHENIKNYEVYEDYQKEPNTQCSSYSSVSAEEQVRSITIESSSVTNQLYYLHADGHNFQNGKRCIDSVGNKLLTDISAKPVVPEICWPAPPKDAQKEYIEVESIYKTNNDQTSTNSTNSTHDKSDNNENKTNYKTQNFMAADNSSGTASVISIEEPTLGEVANLDEDRDGSSPTPTIVTRTSNKRVSWSASVQVCNDAEPTGYLAELEAKLNGKKSTNVPQGKGICQKGQNVAGNDTSTNRSWDDAMGASDKKGQKSTNSNKKTVRRPSRKNIHATTIGGDRSYQIPRSGTESSRSTSNTTSSLSLGYSCVLDNRCLGTAPYCVTTSDESSDNSLTSIDDCRTLRDQLSGVSLPRQTKGHKRWKQRCSFLFTRQCTSTEVSTSTDSAGGREIRNESSMSSTESYGAASPPFNPFSVLSSRQKYNVALSAAACKPEHNGKCGGRGIRSRQYRKTFCATIKQKLSGFFQKRARRRFHEHIRETLYCDDIYKWGQCSRRTWSHRMP